MKKKPKRVFDLKVRCRELDSFKILGFLGEIFGNSMGGFFLEEFFGGFFLVEFYGNCQ